MKRMLGGARYVVMCMRGSWTMQIIVRCHWCCSADCCSHQGEQEDDLHTENKFSSDPIIEYSQRGSLLYAGCSIRRREDSTAMKKRGARSAVLDHRHDTLTWLSTDTGMTRRREGRFAAEKQARWKREGSTRSATEMPQMDWKEAEADGHYSKDKRRGHHGCASLCCRALIFLASCT